MKITAIEEVTPKIKDPQYGYESGYEGYALTLDDGSAVQLLISNESQCCEQWGYLMSNDNLAEFIGAELLNVKTVDHQVSGDGDPYRNTVFVNIETSRGTLQFTAYNEHNGYYGHAVRVTWGDKTIESVTI